METKRFLLSPLLLACGIAVAQNDGDHTITSLTGITYLAPDTLLGVGVAPVRFNIGTLGTSFSLLQVSGHQLNSGEVFRTNSEWFTLGGTSYGTDSHWRMYRATNTAPNNFGMEMGEIYCRNNVPGDLNTNLGFNIQGKRQNGGVWLRNHRGRPNYDAASQILDNDEPRGNGLRLIDDSTRAGGRRDLSDDPY